MTFVYQEIGSQLMGSGLVEFWVKVCGERSTAIWDAFLYNPAAVVNRLYAFISSQTLCKSRKCFFIGFGSVSG